MTIKKEQKQETTVPLNRWRQPRLRVKSDAENVGHASWIELFFDLVFVVVIAELSSTLEKNLDFVSFVKFAALFVPCWWATSATSTTRIACCSTCYQNCVGYITSKINANYEY